MTDLIPLLTRPGVASSAWGERIRENEGVVGAALLLLETSVVLGAGLIGLAAFMYARDIGQGGVIAGVETCFVSAAGFGTLCLVGQQFEFLTERRSRNPGWGVGAVLFGAIGAVGVVQLVHGGEAYSRALFSAQLLAMLGAQLSVRLIWLRLLDRAQKMGGLRGRAVLVRLTGTRALAPCAATGDPFGPNVLRTFDVDCGHSEFNEEIEKIRRTCRELKCDCVVLAFDCDHAEWLPDAVARLSEIPIRIQLLPVSIMTYMLRSRLETHHFGGFRVIELRSGPLSLLDRTLKRGMDVAVAVPLTILLLPVFMIIAILIRLESRGPVLFKQPRSGYGNDPFNILKFRTMKVVEDGKNGFVQARPNDPRVTRIGRLLRRTNADELPQLINVILGDMSLVGPRPHVISHNQMFLEKVSGAARRQNVRPGITGLAQVNGLRGPTDTLEKMRKRVEFDLQYIDEWSVALDLKILLRTVFSRFAYTNAC